MGDSDPPTCDQSQGVRPLGASLTPGACASTRGGLKERAQLQSSSLFGYFQLFSYYLRQRLDCRESVRSAAGPLGLTGHSLTEATTQVLAAGSCQDTGLNLPRAPPGTQLLRAASW